MNKQWTYQNIKDLQALYKISDSALARVLDIDRSTVSRWKERDTNSEAPINYWEMLDRFEDSCIKAQADDSIRDFKKTGKSLGNAVGAAILGMNLFGPIGALTGATIGAALNSNLSSDERECPYCAEVIKKKAKLCKHCHSSVTPIA